MSLSFHFSFCAPGNVRPEGLLEFLKSVEVEAKRMGFSPTLVMETVFDSPERREFARRVVPAIHIDDVRLQGVVLPVPELVRDFSPNIGRCRLEAERAVILVVTDERGLETVFGFARYPKVLKDIHGRVILKTEMGDDWRWRDFVDSGDPRFRQIVKRFAESGYLESEKDEFVEA